MLTVTQSNRLDELAAVIAERLPVGDPFARTTILVSNRLVGTWLRYELARRRGVAGALAIRYLEEWLGAVLGDGLRVIDRGGLAALVASALAGPIVDEPAMAPVRAYLDADGDDARDVRRVQLAARAAGHLWDYALTRPDWLDAWDRGDAADTGDVDPATLAWQRRLYEAVTVGAPAVMIPRLVQAREAAGLPLPRHDGAHLLGFSSLAPAHLRALERLATTGDVHVAMVTPCAEYWEDVAGRRKRGAPPDGDPLALVAWGTPGRDTAGMVLDAVAGDVGERFVEVLPRAPDGARADATARELWMNDVLHRIPPSGTAADPGVRVLACPSVSRELEIVGSEIWRLLRADPSLRASDVAVLLAGDRDRYLAQVGPVFGALHGLPFHLVDAPAAGPGRVAEAAIALLELPLGRFTRRDMLALMTHPAVLARIEATHGAAVDPADWIRWCERLGIVHGADDADHRGTYLERAGGAFHWGQGLERLALGAFVAGPRLGVDAPVVLGGAARLPEELAPDQEASAAAFLLLARSLIADARWLASRREPLARWAEILAAAVETYLGDVDVDADAASGPRARVAQLLRDLADLDLDGRAVPYREVVELARARLTELRAARGEPLVHGVMVAPIEWMRPLPFAAVFVLGLGEGAFPSGERESPLDLRAAHRRRGDVSPRDRDRYAFLEALLAARRHVTLSYVARDEQSGDALSPSSVIHELAEMLAPYLGVSTSAEALEAITVKHPLRRWDDAYVADPALTPSASPAAARERHAAAVRRSLDDHLRARGHAAPAADRLRELLADPALVATRAALRLDLADGAPARPQPDDAPIQVSIAVLRQFLESPVQAWAQVVLGIDAIADEDDREREDEPFDWVALQRATVLRDSFALVLGAAGEPPCSVDDAFDRVWRRHELACQVPRGPFGDAAKRRDLDRLRAWHELLWQRRIVAGPWRRLAFGRGNARSPGAAELRRALAIDVEVMGRRRVVEIVGTTELIGGDRGERTLVLVNNTAGPDHVLRPALDHLVLAAAGEATGTRAGLVLGENARTWTLAAWSQDDARAHLATLAGDLLGGRHAYDLRFAAARALLGGKRAGNGNGHGDHPLGFGPLDRGLGLTAPPDAAELAQRRLAPLLDRAEEDKS